MGGEDIWVKMASPKMWSEYCGRSKQSCVGPVESLKQTPTVELVTMTYETEQTWVWINESIKEKVNEWIEFVPMVSFSKDWVWATVNRRDIWNFHCSILYLLFEFVVFYFIGTFLSTPSTRLSCCCVLQEFTTDLRQNVWKRQMFLKSNKNA